MITIGTKKLPNLSSTTSDTYATLSFNCFMFYCLLFILFIVLLFYCISVLVFYCFIVFIIVLSNIILSEELYEDVEVFS